MFVYAAFLYLLVWSLGLNGQDQAKVEATLKQAQQRDPDDGSSNYHLGEFYLHSDKLSEGIPYMQRAVELQPNNYVAAYDLSLAYFEIHDYDRARRQIELLLKHQPSAESHGLLADIAEGAGDYLKAAAEYQAAAELDPSEDHLFDWGTEFVIHQTYAPATAILKRGVQLHADSVKLHVGLGVALYLNEEYVKAFKELCVATDLHPSEAGPYLFLGRTYADLSPRVETEQVQKRLRRFASEQPKNADALYYYALSLWDRHRDSEQGATKAEVLLTRAEQLDPDSVDVHLQLGDLYSDRHKYRAAIGQFSSVLRLQPNLASAHYRLAQSYFHAGQKKLADQELKIFQELHRLESEESETPRTRLTQFIVSMREESASIPAGRP